MSDKGPVNTSVIFEASGVIIWFITTESPYSFVPAMNITL